MTDFIKTLSTLETDPIRNFRFLVTFTPITGSASADKWGEKFGKLGFVSVSGLSVSTEAIAYREGGYNTNVHQIPGQTAFSPITLSKGIMLGDGVHAQWMKRLFSVLTPDAAAGIGSEFRCNVDIQVLSHPNPAAFDGKGGSGKKDPTNQHTSMRFRVYNAWITALSYSGLDAGANTLMVEEMTLVHEGFDVKFGTAYTTAGSAAPFTN